MKPTATDQKLRGGYYTPKPIATFLANWAIQTPDTSILEPSCGDGMLLEAAAKRLTECGATDTSIHTSIQGIEFDGFEAQKAVERLRAIYDSYAPQIMTGDFFTYCQKYLNQERRFDAIIGNPPFIRYQHFPENQRAIAFYLMQRAGLHPNRLTNACVPFLVASTSLLSKTGKLAMVIPAELLQVNYAAELRYFLSQHYSYITLITFKKLVFDGIQQEVVLLLAERNGSEHTGIRTIELDGIDDLLAYEHTVLSKDKLKVMDHSTEKWTMYFLEEAEKLPLPLIGADTLDIQQLDALLHDGNIYAALDITDHVLLREGLGLSSKDTAMLRTIWQKLRDRRINRKLDIAVRRV